MILPRDEFHRRYVSNFKTEKEGIMYLPVKKLLEECKKDAPFRNHEYLFDGTDLSKLEIYKDEVSGVRKTNPAIKTEEERLNAIINELNANSYEPVPISIDSDYNQVFYIEDGFHRIFGADKIGIKNIKCKVRIGKFILNNSVTLGTTVNLLKLLTSHSFSKKSMSIKGILKLFEKAIEMKPELRDKLSFIVDPFTIKDKDGRMVRAKQGMIDSTNR